MKSGPVAVMLAFFFANAAAASYNVSVQRYGGATFNAFAALFCLFVAFKIK